MANAEISVLQTHACGRDGAPAAVLSAAPPARGSRRRRLWELPSATHCPLMGLGLPAETLRRVIEKTLQAGLIGDDYAAHCLAVQQAAARGPLAEALQRALDARHLLALRRCAALRSDSALAALWAQACRDAGDAGAAMWAVLTHARCTPALEGRVLQDVHMLQHEAGASRRAGLLRVRELDNERAALARALQAAQERAQRAQAELQRRNESLQADLVRLRGEGLRQQTLLAALQADVAALQEAALPAPAAPPRPVRSDAGAAPQRRLSAVHAAPAVAAPAPLVEAPPAAVPAAAPIIGRSVLCVGGMSGVVDRYRRAVEQRGALFMHHDGGIEDSLRRLDGQLGAADLVVCHAGCVAHEAYQQVKAYCKRHRKPCVYLDNPSLSSFERGLGNVQLAGAAA